jgi:hypothetical protein
MAFEEELPNLTDLTIEEKNAPGHILDEKLDLVVTLLVKCYEQLLGERKLLEESLNDGYLNLSKARSQLGCANLSIMQVPAEDHNLKPFVTVEVKNEMKTVRSDDEKNININFSATVYDLVYHKDEIKSIDAQSTEQSAPQIKWFAAFPSLSLRQSQKGFSKSIVIAKNIAELQTRLNVLYDLYKSLNSQKIQR